MYKGSAPFSVGCGWRIETDNCNSCSCLQSFVSFLVHSDEMWCWSGGRAYEIKLSLCYSIVYCYHGAQRYEQFLQVDRLYRALILPGLALYLPSASVSSVFMVLYIYYIFCLHPFLYLSVSWTWWDWPFTWLTYHRPSVLCRCWLHHLTRRNCLRNDL